MEIPLRTFLVEHDDERDAEIQFTVELAMIYTVAPSEQQHIAVCRIAPRRIVISDDALRQTAVGSDLTAATELHDRTARSISVSESQPRDFEPFARQPQGRTTLDDDTARRFGLDPHGAVFRTAARPFEFQIAINTVLHDDSVARTGRCEHTGHLVQRHGILRSTDRCKRKGRQNDKQ